MRVRTTASILRPDHLGHYTRRQVSAHPARAGDNHDPDPHVRTPNARVWDGCVHDAQVVVERVRAGDPAVFEAVFRQHYEGLCTFATRVLGVDGGAEDLVQDVFGSLWVRRASWAVDTTVAAYLYGAVRHKVLDYRKHRSVEERWEARMQLEREGDEACSPSDPLGDRMVGAELGTAVDRAAEALPERCRQVFLLKWVHGLSYREIATALGISRKTVEMQMTRAYKALRQRLAGLHDPNL